MMGEEAPETCWATHKRQVINMWNCCILLVNLFKYEAVYRRGWRRPVRRADKVVTFVCWLSSNSATLNFWSTQGLSRPVKGQFYLLIYITAFQISLCNDATVHRSLYIDHFRKLSLLGSVLVSTLQTVLITYSEFLTYCWGEKKKLEYSRAASQVNTMAKSRETLLAGFKP